MDIAQFPGDRVARHMGGKYGKWRNVDTQGEGAGGGLHR